MLWIRDLSRGVEFNLNTFVGNYFFNKKYVTLEGAVSHNVLYYKHLPLPSKVYANDYFELLPTVSTALTTVCILCLQCNSIAWF